MLEVLTTLGTLVVWASIVAGTFQIRRTEGRNPWAWSAAAALVPLIGLIIVIEGVRESGRLKDPDSSGSERSVP